jgi:pimeloyl-ACP methyl ester carboxylesterase
MKVGRPSVSRIVERQIAGRAAPSRALVAVALVAALVAAGGALACSPVKLDGFLYDPLPAPPGGYQLSTAVIPGHEDLHIATPDGETLHAAFIPSSGRRADVTLLYFHGQLNNVGSSWPRLEYLYPLGYNLVVVDPRGYGLSTGTPTEAGIRIDELATRAALGARPDVDLDRMVYYGHSLGGALAVDLASVTPPRVLVTESTFTSIAELVSDGAYADLPRSFVARSVWDSLSKVARIAAPYMVLHGAADPYVQPRYAQELATAHALAGPTELIMVPGADHDDVPELLGLDVYRARLAAFIEQAIPLS